MKPPPVPRPPLRERERDAGVGAQRGEGDCGDERLAHPREHGDGEADVEADGDQTEGEEVEQPLQGVGAAVDDLHHLARLLRRVEAVRQPEQVAHHAEHEPVARRLVDADEEEAAQRVGARRVRRRAGDHRDAPVLLVLHPLVEHLERLLRNLGRYRSILEGLELDTWESETPAIPIVLGEKEKVYYFWKALLEKGVYSIISIAPGVPPGKDLIRTAISAGHTDEDLDLIEEALVYAKSRI